MKWSPQQEKALKLVSKWFAKAKTEKEPEPFALGGFAGTGKTTLAIELASNASNVSFCAFTGQAAKVMDSKGCHGARTIHSLIYIPKSTSAARLKRLVDEKTVAQTEEEKTRLQLLIEAEKEAMKSLKFALNTDSEAKLADLIIVDEGSMLSEEILFDLMSFGKPVLVLLDPAQIPPVKAVGYFTNRNPDFLLTEIHRQAAGSGILQLATRLRNGEPFQVGNYGDNARVIHIDDLDKDSVPGYDQMLCGRNNTRVATNRRLRERMGRATDMPEVGDRLICLKNDRIRDIMNGSMVEVIQPPVFPVEDEVSMTIQDMGTGYQQYVNAHTQEFAGEEVPYYMYSKDLLRFTYGYSITVHKAQGSEYKRVIMFDESEAFPSCAPAWRYTGATRASEELLVVLT